MIYIGTSLGRCLRSIAEGEVSLDDVLLIITRTDCPTYENYIGVVRAYIQRGNIYAKKPTDYDLSDKDSKWIIEIASTLWREGKIHQPRTFGVEKRFVHDEIDHDTLWLQVVPTIQNSTPAVVEAYEKYRVLDQLTK